MTGLVCPDCNSDFDSDKRLARGDVTECKLCQHKFVVTKNTLKTYQKPVIEAPVQSSPMNELLKENLVKINCPHCSTELQGQISTGQIVECSDCHKQFEATPERLNNTIPVLARTVAPIPEAASRKPKSRAGLLLMIAVGLVFMLSWLLPDSTETKATVEAKQETPPPVEAFVDPGDPKNFLSGWDGSNRELVNLVKSSMNDPKSFEHVETRFRDNGDSLSLVMTFRGKNAFNATVANKVSADLDKKNRTLSNVKNL